MVNTLSRASGGSFALCNSSFRYYDAWGSLETGPGAGNEPRQRYCANLGHLQDDESGLIYMRARYYEPSTGRFVSEDPARDGGNWFCYGKNAPSSNVDWNGTYSASAGLLMSVGVLSAMLSWCFAAGDELAPALMFANIAVGLISASFMVESLAFGLDSVGKQEVWQVRAARVLFTGIPLGSMLVSRGAPAWLNSILGIAAKDVTAGSRTMADIALMGVYVYVMVLCGALLALEREMK